MTSKERAKLKSVAANTDTILQIGKNPIGDAILKQIDDALNARELIKIRVLETCEMLPSEAAQAICGKVRCEVVQVIGSRIVLFKRRSGNDKKPSLLDEAGTEKKTASENRGGKGAAKSGLSNKYGKNASGRERKPQKNEQYRYGSGQNGRSGAARSAQKNGKKSGNFRRGV